MQITNEKIKELIVVPGHISEGEFDLVVKESKRDNKDVSTVLVDKGLIRDDQLGKLIAESLGFSFKDLSSQKVDDAILGFVPELVARTRGVVAFAKSDEGIHVGMTNPYDLETKHFIEKRFGEKVYVYYITPLGLSSALLRYRNSLKEEFDEVLEKLKDPALSRDERDSVAIRMVDLLLRYGYDNKASDIHIEPYEKKIVVRFRIDGVMHDVLDIPMEFGELILTRIKILAKMRTDEHRAAQDGKFQFKSGGSAGGEAVDVRVSIVPVTGGENVVMRILSSHSRQFNLSSLGLLSGDLLKVERATKKPHGMILVTGPTGSGKTTTVYAVLKILNKREVHISTIEDPVEYDIEGISQIQVNTRTDLTFAKGLRAIVRQDPDVIMVGEIRDEETAGIAVNSAMTGHLVLSTLHTNDAATTLPRLLDMNIEPFLVASTVNVAIAQRLVRKVCEQCRASYTLSKEEQNIIERDDELKKIFKKHKDKNLKNISFFKGSGCKTCGDTGYSGRIGVFEVLEMSEEIRDLIVKRASSDEILKKAKKEGMTTMLEDGIEKALQGLTTIEEVVRMTKT